MVMGDTESCGSRVLEFSVTQSRKRRTKAEVYSGILDGLRDLDEDEVRLPGFEDELWAHFCRLPTRYALDVNVERAKDVLMHKKLLHLAGHRATRPAVEVRLVQAYSISDLFGKPFVLNSQKYIDAQSSKSCSKNSIHPPPAFGFVHDVDSNVNAFARCSRQMHEITISTIDKPKLLSRLTSLLSAIGLNIQEAHAFSTIDGYSLDVFVVDGWKNEETEQLKAILVKEISQIKNLFLSKNLVFSPRGEQEQSGTESISYHVSIPSNGCNVGEIDISLLRYGNKIASRSYGDLYRGTFCGQDVAIKVLNGEHLTENNREDFAQEVYILRRVQHKNVVKFIGACARPPSLCIVTEFLSGGSVYDFLHKQKGAFGFPSLVRAGIDVSEGMKYLHQNNIVHRDLKTANLLMDENGVVKVSDFGIARVQTESGVMTAETGTYRWMAPEVIEHRPYNHKADVFSFAIVLWELLTGKLPYKHLTPMQAAVGVAQKGLRPAIPSQTHPKLRELIERCWQQDPSLRPDFSEIEESLQGLSKWVTEAETTATSK